MYKNIFYDRRNYSMHIWDDKFGHKSFPYKRYAYIKSPTGDKISLDGTKVKKITKWDEDDEARGVLYESDVNPETRTLIDMYHTSDEPSQLYKVMYLDIEVDTTNNFPDITTADNEITAISYYAKDLEQYFVFILDKEGVLKPKSVDNVVIYPFSTEEELLNDFISLYSDYSPDIITGWNIDFFDMPYLYNRISKVLGKKIGANLSPIGVVDKNKRTGIYSFAGVTCLDYLALYKKFVPNEEPSYTLDAISMKELGKGKIKYEGTLDNLFKTDIDKFIEYNLNDVVLVKAIDDKLKYIDLTRSICHKGHVPYSYIFASSRYLEGAILTYMKNLDIVSTNIPSKEEEDLIDDDDDDETEAGGKFEGAYVKPPIPGRYEWLTCLDATSLYPTAIMTLNISPETVVAKVHDWDTVNMISKSKGKHNPNLEKLTIEYNNGKTALVTKDEVLKYLSNNKFAIGGNGAIYDQSSKGLIPSILERWFDERLEYKELMKKYSKEGNKEKEEYFDGLQYATKILLNSMYGVLGLSSFRFHNLWNAEAVTITGQDILRFADKMSNSYLKNKFACDDKDKVIYEDTDSCYILLDQFIKRDGTEIDQVKVLSGEIAEHINSNLDSFVKAHLHSDYNKFVFKEESAIKSGFWLAKKRYAYYKVWDLEADKPADKLIIKGLDVVRSNFPKVFRSFMKEILFDILKFETRESIDDKIIDIQFKLDTFDLVDIAKPTSAKNLDKFKCDGLNFKKKTPAHIKAAMAYNFLLKHHNLDTKIQPILSGSKIKWVYIRNNKFGLDAIAFKGQDDPKQIFDFISEHIDYSKNFESNLANKLQDFYLALNWGLIPDKNTSKVNSFFGF